jgi:hypothetical protein
VRAVSKSSATGQEKEHAQQLARQVMLHLRNLGFPDPVCADSGNGTHLLYAMDLPSRKDVTRILRRLLERLADQFSTEHATVDKSVFNPSRISKLPGTVARKGEHTADRPHRTAQLLHVPEVMQAVPLDLLCAAAGCAVPDLNTPEQDPTAASPPASDNGHAGTWDIPALLAEHQL